jgi:NADH-quinone oxidoreductase subunit C
MSKKVLDRLKSVFGDRILEATSFRGDDQAVVAPKDWLEIAKFLREDPQCAMDHFLDITAADYPERETNRFDVLLFLRSMSLNHRVRLKTRVGEGESLASLFSVWPGTDWGEREVYDMFGVKFTDHPDLRRILLYDEFVGFPLRKDYPIAKTQPLVAYREVEGTDKLAPFGDEEGQPFGRIDWNERLAGRDMPVSPAISVQVGARKTLSQGSDDIEPVSE